MKRGLITRLETLESQYGTEPLILTFPDGSMSSEIQGTVRCAFRIVAQLQGNLEQDTKAEHYLGLLLRAASIQGGNVGLFELAKALAHGPVPFGGTNPDT